MNSKLDPDQLAEYLAMDEDELLTLLVPKSQHQAFSRDGLIVRGRQVFEVAWAGVQKQICAKYQEQKDSITLSIDGLAMIAAAIGGAATLSGLPLYPFAAIVLKIGLNRLCPREPTTS